MNHTPMPSLESLHLLEAIHRAQNSHHFEIFVEARGIEIPSDSILFSSFVEVIYRKMEEVKAEWEEENG